MCRFLAWVGAPHFVDALVLDQKQSLVAQSRNALIGKTPINAHAAIRIGRIAKQKTG
ncbi:glutamine amidotransferase [Thioclava dalianensis]|nr:glutamine amidotransferase [Thioclava dalianensis]